MDVRPLLRRSGVDQSVFALSIDRRQSDLQSVAGGARCFSFCPGRDDPHAYAGIHPRPGLKGNLELQFNRAGAKSDWAVCPCSMALTNSWRTCSIASDNCTSAKPSVSMPRLPGTPRRSAKCNALAACNLRSRLRAIQSCSLDQRRQSGTSAHAKRGRRCSTTIEFRPGAAYALAIQGAISRLGGLSPPRERGRVRHLRSGSRPRQSRHVSTSCWAAGSSSSRLLASDLSLLKGQPTSTVSATDSQQLLLTCPSRQRSCLWPF
jgi:hypothetical protein